MWFWAAGNSQLVGVNALRPILDQFFEKDIYLISHSRGASAILSALANPVYDPRFVVRTVEVARTWGSDERLLWPTHPLSENQNRIHVLMLAPAVDWIDFCDESEQPSVAGPYECKKFRAFSPQLKSVRYTVNSKDKVLNKFVGLAAYFNPTRLGTATASGDRLEKIYPFMHRYFLEPNKDHGFRTYIANVQFDRMLADEKIGPRLNENHNVSAVSKSAGFEH